MTDETLEKANKYKEQIHKLGWFVYTCRKCWKRLRIAPIRFRLRTAYGILSDEIEVDRELSERILQTIEEYKHELEQELEKL